jgi:hypothetical protein
LRLSGWEVSRKVVWFLKIQNWEFRRRQRREWLRSVDRPRGKERQSSRGKI